MQKTFTFCSVKFKPGQRKSIDVPISRLYTHADISMPVHVIHGIKAGPCLFICAAVHGDELNGIEIIYRLLRHRSLSRLRGTLIVVPIVNVYGIINHSRYLPDRRDLNRSFPGSPTGSLTAQLAHFFMKEIVPHCTHGIDLHTGSHHRANLPHLRANLHDEATLRLAKVFRTPVILNADVRDGSLRQAVVEKGIPMLLYEGGEALRFNEIAVRAGLRGILSVMREIGMLAPPRKKNERVLPLISEKSVWIRSPKSGIFRSRVRLGDRVAARQILGFVHDPLGEDEVEIKSTVTGILIGQLKLPLVYRGDAIYHIACLEGSLPIEDTLEAFEEEIDLEFQDFD